MGREEVTATTSGTSRGGSPGSAEKMRGPRSLCIRTRIREWPDLQPRPPPRRVRDIEEVTTISNSEEVKHFRRKCERRKKVVSRKKIYGRKNYKEG